MLSSLLSIVNVIPGLHYWKISVSVLTIYFIYWLLKPRNIRTAESVGYDHLFKKQRSKINEKSKADTIADSKKNRVVGNVRPVFPNGWFGILESNQVAIREVKYVSALGEHFAVYRVGNGKVNILSAYCPHLGANIAIGGTVIGNCIECPFHGWTFDGMDGSCVSIPYSKSVPAESKLKCWPCCEVNTFIFVWYHAENKDPSWFPEIIPNIHDGKWWYRGRTEHYINTHVENYLENTADAKHFPVLHGYSLFTRSNTKNKINWLGRAITHPFDVKWISPIDEKKPHIGLGQIRTAMKIMNKFTLFESFINAQQIGPGIIFLHSECSLGQTMSIYSIIPVEPLLVKVVHKLFYPPTSLLYGLLFYYSSMLVNERDIMIWNHMKYEDKPLFIKEEDAVKRYRRWYSQFYTKNNPRYRPNTLEW